MEPAHILLLVNPESGTGITDAALGTMLRSLAQKEASITLRFTDEPGDAKRWITEAVDRYDKIIIAGGDGSVKEAADGLLHSNPDLPLGIIPTGSTCDFAVSVGIPKDAVKASEYLLESSPQKIDVGTASGEHFIYICSFGAFTETSWQTPRESKKVWGHMAYVIDAAKRLPKMRSYHCQIVTENEAFEDDWWFGAIINSRQVGGVVKLPESDVHLDDGKMELLLIRAPKDVTALPLIISDVLTGTYNHEDIIYRHVSKVTLDFDVPVAFTLDGEYGGDHAHMEVEVLHHALTLLSQ